jgi:hypothetical protein
MLRLKIVIFSVGVVVNILSQSSWAEEPKVKVSKVDPGVAVKDVLTGDENDCGIVMQNGRTYKVCPYGVTPEVQAAIRAEIDNLK